MLSNDHAKVKNMSHIKLKKSAFDLSFLSSSLLSERYFTAKSSRWPRALWTIFRIKRDILAAAHDAAKINVSQRANVRLARSRDVLGAQCVERKQPPPQDALLPTHSTSDLCFFFPPSIQGLAHARFASRLKSMCRCSPKSASFFFQECHVWVMAHKNALYY